jgi:hypothetical protein
MKEQPKNLSGVKKWFIIGVILIFIGAVFAAGAFVIYRFNSKLNLANNTIAELQAIQSDYITELQAMMMEQFRLTNESITELQDMQPQPVQIPVQLQHLQRALITADMANKVEELTRGLDTDQDKALAIARWVSANISNRTPELSWLSGMGNVWSWYAERQGLCGWRTEIFIEMLKLVNIPAKMFNMYDFPFSPDGHTCVQVWYDNSWHFFDVTYAGVFMDGDKVMSFEEIVANPQFALDNMVIFEETLDTNNTAGFFDENMVPWRRTRVDNIYRMKVTYTLESLTGFRSFHFVDGVDIAIVYPKVDSSNLPITLGTLNNSWVDIRTELTEAQSSISTMVAHGLGGMYQVKSHWQFRNLIPGEEYYIIYHIYEVAQNGGRFRAVPDGAEIISGHEMVLDDTTTKWIITFTPTGSECSILIDHDVKWAGTGAYIDMIEIGIIQD